MKYYCDAGGEFNRFESDFDKNVYELTCLPENKFSTPEWPTCVPGIRLHVIMQFWEYINWFSFSKFCISILNFLNTLFLAVSCPNPYDYETENITSTKPTENETYFNQTIT